jgi:hypothetical protein
MSFKSFLSAAGHDFVAVFKYLGSPAGQKTVQIAEGAAVVAGTLVGGPGLGAAISGVELLINKGLAGVLAMEASSAAVAAQSGTGVQKGLAVTAQLIPQAEALLQQLGFSNPTEEQVLAVAGAVSKGIADIVNSIPAPVVPPAA